VPAFAAASSSKPAGVAGKCRDGAILETSSRQHRFTPVVVHPCRLVGFGIRTKTSDYKCAADYEQKIERRGDRPACIQGSLIPGSLDDVAALDQLAAAQEKLGNTAAAEATRTRIKYLRAPTVEWYLLTTARALEPTS